MRIGIVVHVADERIDIQERQHPGIELEVGVEDLAGGSEVDEIADRLARIVVERDARVGDFDLAAVETGDDQRRSKRQRQFVAALARFFGEERQS